MLWLSEVMMKHHELESFEQLVKVIEQEAKGNMHFQMDVKPTYPDTPDNWEDRLEAAFS